MALNRRTGNRFQASIWPGFVDAMTGLLLVLMFVLTIFTVIQFVLMETISGQEDEMFELSAEVSALADALGLERDRTATLTSEVGSLTISLDDAEAQAAAQSVMILSLRSDLAQQTEALNEANSQITAFEDQVAALLSEQASNLGAIATLEASEAELLSEQEALNLALVTARSEIDAQVEQARLAAAREEALQALIADLESENLSVNDSLAAALASLNDEETKVQLLSQELLATMASLEETSAALAEEEQAKLAEQAALLALQAKLADTETALSEEEKARLAEAASAEALRERLKNAQSELTAMTLALEAKRKEAEDTLTLLAAAKSAEDGLNAKLAAALLANAELDLKLQETQSSLEDAETAQENAGSQLTTIEAALAQALINVNKGTDETALVQAKLDEALFELSRAQDRMRSLVRQLAALRTQVEQNEETLGDLTSRYEDEKNARVAAELAISQAGVDQSELTELLAQTQTAADLANETAARALAAQEAAETRVGALRGEAARLQDELSTAQQISGEATGKVGDLELALARALAERENLTSDHSDLEVQLAAALAAKLSAQAGLEQLRSSETNQAQTLRTLEEELAKALEAKLAAEAAANEGSDALTSAARDIAVLREKLAQALLRSELSEEEIAEKLTAAERNAALLKIAQEELSTAAEKTAEQQRDLALLNAQVSDLRTQMGRLQSLIDDSEAKDIASQVQITNLGSRLNTALTRAAASERRLRRLEEENSALLAAEKERLEAENEALEKYRSDFFGKLRDLVGDREGVQIVGDRFVFSSEVLFSSGEAELSEEGKNEIANIADLLNEISVQIPSEIDWIIRVDGHTDNIRMLPGGDFADNWELSQARALSVVRDLVVEHGMKPNRLSSNGFGQYQPLNPANNAEARAQNRRIELKLTER